MGQLIFSTRPAPLSAVRSLEQGFLRHVGRHVRSTPFLTEDHKGRISPLMKEGVSVRELADFLYFSLVASYVVGRQSLPGGQGLSMTMHGPEVLFRTDGAAPQGRRSIQPSDLRQRLGHRHLLSDRVLEVRFETRWDFLLLNPDFSESLNIFSLLFSFDEALLRGGLKLFSASEDESGRFFIPSLSLFEAVVRSLVHPSHSFCIVPGRVDPATYDALWEVGYRTIGLPLKKRHLEELRKPTDPLTYSGHDLYHAIHDWRP